MLCVGLQWWGECCSDGASVVCDVVAVRGASSSLSVCAPDV